MRVTNSMMMNEYTRTMSDNLESLNNSYSRVSTEKKFTKVSQDPVDAIKTLKTLHNMNTTSTYSDDISEASSLMTNTESTLKTVTSILTQAQEDILAANNGTSSSTDYSTYSKELSGLQDQLLDTLNSTYNGDYVFGGSASDSAPFQLGSSGQLQIYDYNAVSGSQQYVDFDDIATSTVSGSLYGKDDFEISNQIDVGLGLTVNGSGKIESGTAFDAATSSVDLLSLSMDSTGGTNVFDTLSGAVSKLDTAISSKTSVNLDDELNQIYDAEDNASDSTTVVGQKSKLLSFLSDKTDTQSSNQTTRLSSLEDVNIAKAVMDYETKQVVYNASLSVGSKILQNTIIDFIQ